MRAPADSAEEVVMVPDDEGSISYVFPIFLSENDSAHLRMVIGPRNRLLAFALTQRIRMEDGWHDVVRYDCSHRVVHVHRFTRGGAESVREIFSLEEIDHGYDAAVADILDNWEENRRRYLHD
jgi:hypothetical protein